MSKPETYRVELLAKSSVVVRVRYGQSILDAAKEAGQSLPSSCRVGHCVTCAGRVLEGTIEQNMATGLSPSQKARGFALLCVATPLDDCRIDVGFAAQGALYQPEFDD